MDIDKHTSLLPLEITCGLLRAPRYGSVQLSGTDVKSKATYSCGGSLELVGQTTRTCQKSGEWSSTAPRCVQKSELRG
jgi:hypothetical protein